MADAANKIAIVTGAGTGVGRAASLALMNAGFTVVLAGRRMEMLEETKKLGDNVGKSLCVSADMTSPGSIAALFAKVMDTYGRLDVLVVRTDACEADLNHRIEAGEPYFHDLRSRWSAALRAAHQNIPRPPYKSETEAKN